MWDGGSLFDVEREIVPQMRSSKLKQNAFTICFGGNSGNNKGVFVCWTEVSRRHVCGEQIFQGNWTTSMTTLECWEENLKDNARVKRTNKELLWKWNPSLNSSQLGQRWPHSRLSLTLHRSVYYFESYWSESKTGILRSSVPTLGQ